MLWNLMERACTQGAQLLVSIILARLLMPEAYGILALITVFVNLATVLVAVIFCLSIGSCPLTGESIYRSIFS